MATKNGLRIRPELKSGKFKYRAYLDYKHHYEDCWKQVTIGLNSTTKTVLEEAKNKLLLKVEKILGEGNKKKTSLTISEALDLWLDFRKGSVATGTLQKDKNNTRVFREKFGRWQVSKLEKEHIKDYLMGLKISPSSLNNYRASVNLLLQFCEDEGYIKENPMNRVRLPQHKETLAEKEKREDKYFTVKEMGLLLEAMEARANDGRSNEIENHWRKRMMIEFQFSIGTRVSELSGLRYQDIDFEAGVLRLKAQYDRFSSSVKAPKLSRLKTTHSERDISLKVRELEILDWFKARNENHSDFVFVQENGHLIAQEHINRYLKEFSDVLPYKLKSSFVSHALRHSNVMLQKELGVDEQVIVQRGGWADTQMISRVYGRHVTPVLIERADQLLQDFSVKNSRNIHEKSEESGGASISSGSNTKIESRQQRGFEAQGGE